MITILNVSQRINGINDQICECLADKLDCGNFDYKYIKTRDLNISICNNCRLCMQSPGNELGVCHFKDDMRSFVDTLLNSDAVIMSSPVNCYDLPSIVRILLERMSIFCYWNEDMYSPSVRDTGKDIKGVLITTSALPGIMVPILTRVKKTFKLFAKPLRIKKIDYYHLGFKGRKQDIVFNEKDRNAVHKIISMLVKAKKNTA